MLILLGLSTLAAALVDTRTLRDEGTGSTAASGTETRTGTTTGIETVAEADPRPRGKRLGLSIEIGRRVKVVPMEIGDQLTMRIRWTRSGLVEIEKLGLLEPVAPGSPAIFDVLGQEPASYGVRLLEPDRLVARIEVTKPKPAAKGPEKATGG